MTLSTWLRQQNFCSHRLLWLLTLMPIQHLVRLELCRAQLTRSCPDWALIFFSDESHFHLWPDDNRRCGWRKLRKWMRGFPVLTVASHTGPQQGVIFGGVISFDSQTHLVIIYGTITSQLYEDDILWSVMLHSFCDILDLLFGMSMPTCTQKVLLWIVFKSALHFFCQLSLISLP